MTTTWLRLTAIPNEDHQDSAPRAKFLINASTVAAFKVTPDRHVDVWFDWNASTTSITVVESLEEIEVQLGIRSPSWTSWPVADQVKLVGERGPEVNP